eukprot:scaffold5.g741.t1
MDVLFEAVFTARVVGGGGGAPPARPGADPQPLPQQQRGVLACRVDHPRARPLPAADNLLSFCFPLGVASLRSSAFLVTEEFSFTLTGGDGSRLHGFCRKSNDPTRPASAASPRGARGGRFPQVLCLISRHAWPAFFFKVLEVVDPLLRGEGSAERLPPGAPAAAFLAGLAAAVPPPPAVLGAVVRVPLPALPSGAPPIDWAELRMQRALPAVGQREADASAVELEVPPALGNGPENAGISLARLLFFLTPRQATTLLASLLLERRVILVSKSADTVSSAVAAAAALLYPLRWQHIFLPLLPVALRDYLAAPMPYLVGIQAECLPMLRDMALEEVVMLDLDTLGHCHPPLGSAADDAWALPYADELTDAFDFVRDHIRNPSEFHTTPKATEMVQSFLLKLLWRYRMHILPEGALPAAPAPPAAPPPPRGGAPPGGPRSRPGSRPGSARGGSGGSRRELGADDAVRAHGYAFDQAGFLAAHARNARLATFLAAFRHSQMFEQFVAERLRWAAEGWPLDDPFEQKVSAKLARHGTPLGELGSQAKGRLGAVLRKTASLVKSGSSRLVDGIRSMGSSSEQELEAASTSLGSLHRPSPSLGGLQRPSPSIGSLQRPSPGAHGLVAHRSQASFGSSLGAALGAATAPAATPAAAGLRASSSSGSLHSLHRASPGPRAAAPHGGAAAPVSLEEARPELFFGDDVDDADSVGSADSSMHGTSGGGAWSGRSSPGPLEAGLGGAPGGARALSSLHLHLAPSPSAAPAAGASAPLPSPHSSTPAGQAPAAGGAGSGTAGKAAGQVTVNVSASAGGAGGKPPLLASLNEPRTQGAASRAAPAAAAAGAGAGWALNLRQRSGPYSPLANGALQSLTLREGLQPIKSEGSLEWAAFASATAEAAAAEAAAAAAIHSPLAQATAAPAGGAGAGAPHRRTSSSSGSLQSRLSVAADAFGELVLDAAADAEQHMVQHQRRLSSLSGGGTPRQGAAAHGGAVDPPWSQLQGQQGQQQLGQQQLGQQQQQEAGPQQQEQQQPVRPLSAGDKVLSGRLSWGDWEAAWGPQEQRPAGAGQLPPVAEVPVENGARPAHARAASLLDA